jgi:hypothetical protein
VPIIFCHSFNWALQKIFAPFVNETKSSWPTKTVRQCFKFSLRGHVQATKFFVTISKKQREKASVSPSHSFSEKVINIGIILGFFSQQTKK